MVLLYDIIDRLAVEKGIRKKKVYHLEITTGELMEPLGLKPSIPHHRHVKFLVEANYHGTTVESIGINGERGFKLHLRIWSV